MIYHHDATTSFPGAVVLSELKRKIVFMAIILKMKLLDLILTNLIGDNVKYIAPRMLSAF